MDNEDSLGVSVGVFAEDTSLHGLKYICRKGEGIVRRCVWAVVFCGMLATLLYSLNNLLEQYYRFESTLSVSVYTAQELQMPSITFCGHEYINEESIRRHFDNDTAEMIIKEYMKVKIYGEDPSPEFVDFMHNTTAFEALKVFNKLPITMCSLPQSANMIEECKQIVTHTFIHHHSFMCETFPSWNYITNNGPIMTNVTGMFSDKNIFLELDMKALDTSKTLREAMFAVIHSPKIYPNLDSIDMLLLSTGYSYAIDIEMEEYHALKKPYSKVNCWSDEEADLQQVNSLPSMPYSKESCLQKCTEDMTYSVCNCSINTSGNYCTLYDYIYCTSIKNNQLDKALCPHCLQRCKTVAYRVSMSQFPNPTPNLSRAGVIINYSSLDYKVTAQIQSLTTDQLMSNFGGLMGLCIGASVLSLLEILDFLVGILFKKLQLLHQKNNHRTDKVSIK